MMYLECESQRNSKAIKKKGKVFVGLLQSFKRDIRQTKSK